MSGALYSAAAATGGEKFEQGICGEKGRDLSGDVAPGQSLRAFGPNDVATPADVNTRRISSGIGADVSVPSSLIRA